MMPQPKDWLDKLFTRTMPNDKELQAHYGWQQRDTAYKWYTAMACSRAYAHPKVPP